MLSEDLAVYRATAYQRWYTQQHQLQARRQQASQVIEQAAIWLKEGIWGWSSDGRWYSANSKLK